MHLELPDLAPQPEVLTSSTLVALPPGQPTSTLTDATLGMRRRMLRWSLPGFVVLALFAGLRSQLGQAHSFNVTQAALVAGVTFLAFAAGLALVFTRLSKAIVVGEGWVARQHYGQRRWRYLPAEAIVAVYAVSAKGRDSGYLCLSDRTGRGVTLDPPWLDAGLREPLQAMVAQRPVLTASGASLLAAANSPRN